MNPAFQENKVKEFSRRNKPLLDRNNPKIGLQNDPSITKNIKVCKIGLQWLTFGFEHQNLQNYLIPLQTVGDGKFWFRINEFF